MVNSDFHDRFNSEVYTRKNFSQHLQNLRNPKVCVKHIYVKDLFSTFTHDIRLNLESKITILTAPNGYGKSTILKMTKDIVNGNYSSLTSIPFREFRVTLSDGRTLVAVRDSDNTLHGPVDYIEFTDGCGRVLGKHIPNKVTMEDVPVHRKLSEVLSLNSYLQRIDEDLIYDSITRETLSTNEAIRRYYIDDNRNVRSQVMGPIEELRFELPIQYVPADRLGVDAVRPESRAGSSRRRTNSTVDNINTMVVSQVRESMTNYVHESRSLDSTFTERILSVLSSELSESSQPTREDIDRLTKMKSEIDESERRYKSLELSQRFRRPKPLLRMEEIKSSAALKVLEMHLEDSREKSKTLNSVVQRLELFTELLSNLYNNKRVEYSQREGLVVRTIHGDEVDLNKLSSGEKNLLVLFGNLLFNEFETLVMMDEPELSLHIEWQMKFLPIIEQIVAVQPVNVIIATHSPILIGSRCDFTVALEDK
jgi:predicted ATPase